MMGLSLRKVEISLGSQRLLALDLDIAAGEIVTVMGPSGAGKSALLAYVSGMLPPAFRAQGEVWLNGQRIDGLAPEARHAGLLFQDDLLFPFLSVAGNLAFGLKAGGSRAERREVIEAALAQAGLAGFANRDPATLSGGQRARVSLLRVLLSKPQALLLDEPFGKLDAGLRAQFRELVFSTARERALPVLLVTHDAADAEAAGGPCVQVGKG